MTKSMKKTIDNLFEKCQFPKDYFIRSNDYNGKTFAIFVKTNEAGGISLVTNFYKPSELEAYLLGYYHAKIKKDEN